MSDVSMFGFRSSEKSGDTSDRKTKIVMIVFFVLCAAFLLEIVVYKLVLPSMGTPKITYSGANRVSVEEMSALLAPMKNLNWFAYSPEEAVSILSSVPAVDSVTVSKHFPDRISIAVTERQPVAMTFISDNGRSVPVQIDRNGVLFDGSASEQQDNSIPIISGLPVEHLSEGMRIPAKYLVLIDQISHIQSLPQKYFAAISEICVMPKEYGNYELMLIPAKSRTRVLTDRALNEDALQYMMVVLDVVNSIEPNVSEIDLRYGSVSYSTR
jgi:Cell division septal protein